MKQIVWRAIPGWEDLYLISSVGEVFSLRRNKRLRLHKDNDRAGRLRVQLNCNGIGKTYKVSTLVARAFIGEPPVGTEVCHNDGNPLNNDVDNLRYDTHSNNALDITKHGRGLSAKTHCANNHRFTEQSTVWYNGWRSCLICRNDRNRARYNG
jgi:hypothetical protein